MRLADTLAADYDTIDLLHGLVTDCVALFAVDAAGLALADPRGGLGVVATSSEDARLVELFERSIDDGPGRSCFETGDPVTTNVLGGARVDWPAFTQRAAREGFGWIYALPLRLRGQTIGALTLCSSSELPRADVVAAQALTAVATISVLQQRALDRAHTLTEQLDAALNSRVIIEQAKGRLGERAGIDENAAFTRLRAYARRTRRRLTDVAYAVVTGTADETEVDALLTTTDS